MTKGLMFTMRTPITMPRSTSASGFPFKFSKIS